MSTLQTAERLARLKDFDVERHELTKELSEIKTNQVVLKVIGLAIVGLLVKLVFFP
jgi:hypothetical protein